MPEFQDQNFIIFGAISKNVILPRAGIQNPNNTGLPAAAPYWIRGGSDKLVITRGTFGP